MGTSLLRSAILSILVAALVYGGFYTFKNGVISPQPAAAAAGVAASLNSFGGRIITQPIPCVSAGSASLWFTVLQPFPKQPSFIALIWTPVSITKLWGPPRTIGQKVLGTWNTPSVCYTYAAVPVPLPGFNIFEVGTSLF